MMALYIVHPQVKFPNLLCRMRAKAMGLSQPQFCSDHLMELDPYIFQGVSFPEHVTEAG